MTIQPIAFVLLQNPATLNPLALVDVLRQRHPERAWDEPGDTKNPENPVNAFIRCGERLVVLMVVEAPVPKQEDLWSRAAFIWPAAQEAAGRHRAHIVVSILSKDGTNLDNARIVTAVVGGLVSIVQGACAVVMGGKAARSPELWQQMSQRSFGPYPEYPFTLWVDIAPFRSGQSIAAFTVGLATFVGREIEFEVPGMDQATTVQRVAGLTSYLIEHGDVIKDGHTVGTSETDCIKAHHGVSRFNGSPVLRVGPDAAPTGTKRYPIIPMSIAKAHPLLIMLNRVGLFDAASPDNQVQLRPEAYASETRLDSYDQGIQGVLSKIVASDPYVEADKKARAALERGDAETAKSALMPFAKDVEKFQHAARHALGSGNLFMFLPKQGPTRAR
jgi:hypothetical protein